VPGSSVAHHNKFEEKLALLSKLFHRHERNMGDEDAYYLARDSEDPKKVFVLHKSSYRKRGGLSEFGEPSSAQIELETFLNHRGTPQDKLRELLGTLVTEEDRAW
jgi:hypothetical protein